MHVKDPLNQSFVTNILAVLQSALVGRLDTLPYQKFHLLNEADEIVGILIGIRLQPMLPTNIRESFLSLWAEIQASPQQVSKATPTCGFDGTAQSSFNLLLTLSYLVETLMGEHTLPIAVIDFPMQQTQKGFSSYVIAIHLPSLLSDACKTKLRHFYNLLLD